MTAIGHTIDPSKDWVKAYRSLRSHPVVGFLNEDGTPRGIVVCEAMAWLDLTMEAGWKDRTVNNKGKVILIERGQLLGARDWLAQRWGWTAKKVRYFMEKLARNGMIQTSQPRQTTIGVPEVLGPAKGQAKGNSVNVITVCNYNVYQTISELEELLDGQRRGQQGASKGPESKKVRREEEERSPYGDSSSAAPNDPLQLDLGDQPAKLTASVAAREAFAIYNETAKRCGLPTARVFDKERAKALAMRVKDAGGLEGFRQAMLNIERSAFLRGQTDKPFKADLNFVCQRSSFIRLLEGGYGNGAHSQGAAMGGKYKQAYQRLVA